MLKKKNMEVDYNMLVQNHVHYKYADEENHFMGQWCNC
jgi:hypothetical protein